jgi:hypothetical protein
VKCTVNHPDRRAAAFTVAHPSEGYLVACYQCALPAAYDGWQVISLVTCQDMTGLLRVEYEKLMRASREGA